MNQTSLSAIPEELPPRGEDFTRFMNLLHESESLGLKNDYDSRIGQFEALFRAVFDENGYRDNFSIILVNELINEAQNLIGFYYHWEPLKRLMNKIADRFERNDEDKAHFNDAFITAVLDRALEWHLHDITTRIATRLQDHIAKLDTNLDDDEREFRLKLGMRVAKINYLNAQKSNNQDAAQMHLDNFKEYLKLLGHDEKEQLNKLEDSVKNYSFDALPFINFINRKIKHKKTDGNSSAVLGIYYNALQGILRNTRPEDAIRPHVIPYLLQKIFESQIPRISEAIEKEKVDKALEYTLTILCCLGGIMPGKKAEAESLSNDYLADGGKTLLESIKKFVENNIPRLTSTHFKGQEHRRYLLGYMADLVEGCWDNLSELCSDCGKLLESVALYLVAFMENDKNKDKEQGQKEAVDAARLYYFFYEKASGDRKEDLFKLCKNAIDRAVDNEREPIIASLQFRISPKESYHDLFITLRNKPDTVFPKDTLPYVLKVKEGLCALKKQLDSETAATKSGKNLHDAILDFLHYSAYSLLKQSTSSNSDLRELISNLQKQPTNISIDNEVYRIETILQFLHGRKRLPDEQFRQFVLAAIDTLKESGTKKVWKRLGYAVNSHGSDKTKAEALNKLVKFVNDYSYPAFNLIAMHWLLNHKGSFENALNVNDLNNYLSKSMVTYYNVIDIYETFTNDFGKNRTSLTEILINWVKTILSNYRYSKYKEIIYVYLGLLYFETGNLEKANHYRDMYAENKPKDCKDLPIFKYLQKRLRIIPRFETGSDNSHGLEDHDTGPANKLIMALRDHKQFIYLIHKFESQLNDAGRPLTANDLVNKYRDPLFSLLKNPQLHFDTGKLLYQYVFKDKFSEDHKSFGASRNEEEWNAAIKKLKSILETEGNIKAKIIPQQYLEEKDNIKDKDISKEDRKKIQFRFPEKFRYSYRAYWPSIQSALSSILFECQDRSNGGETIVEVSECDDKKQLRIEVISSCSERTTNPTKKIRDNIIEGKGGHAGIVIALWGLCDFGLQYGDNEPMKILGDVSKRKQNVNPTDLVYIIHLPSVDDAGTTDNALSDSGTADTHAESETDGNNNISMVL